MKELWYYFYEQAIAEGCNDEDAAKMADLNSAEYLADKMDMAKEMARENCNG